MLFVNLDWDTFSIVVNFDETFLFVDVDLENIHFAVPVVVVSSVD